MNEHNYNQIDHSMIDIINRIRNCNMGCYRERYLYDLKTYNGRVITVNELRNGQPLIDDWRKQNILFLSQAPSRQAWADHSLSSAENLFFRKFLLPELFPSISFEKASEIWENNFFWVHTANCYPYVYTEGKNKCRDKPPNLKCVNRYLDEILNTMKPKLIILMGGSATRYFSRSIRTEIDSKKIYPSLDDILTWQNEKKRFILVTSKNDNIKKFKCFVIPHAVSRDDLSEIGKESYRIVINLLRQFIDNVI